MAEEFENKEVQSEQNENSRDGYSAAEQGSYQREYRAAGRPQRPRIHTQRAYSTDNSSNNNEEGGFRPEALALVYRVLDAHSKEVIVHARTIMVAITIAVAITVVRSNRVAIVLVTTITW